MANRINMNVLFFLIICSLFFQQNHAQCLELFRRTGSLNPVPGCAAFLPANDDSLIARLIKAYQTSENDMNRGNSMWQYIFNQNHIAIHQVFKNGQFEAAANILRHPASTELFYGIDDLTSSYMVQFQNPLAPAAVAAHYLDSLIRFGEAIGAIRLDNPEAYYKPPVVYDGESVLKIIEQYINISLSFPNPYPYEYGLLTSKGIVSERVPQSLYQAWKIKQLVRNIKNPRVLEIGAGLGRTAFYASLFGIKDYTIIDLPFTAICSGYFLGRSLGEDQIVLHGENLSDSEAKIKILTPEDFLNGNIKYDLIINVDSMTEIDPNIARLYMKKIESSTKTFLSINHEINPFTVAEIIKESDSVLKVTRHPYWLRNGYVEEVVRFK